MNKAQKVFLELLVWLGYVLVTMASLINAMFDNSMGAQLLPVVLIGSGIGMIFIILGKERNK